MPGKVEIFCDGACSGNPGEGGYGTILRYGTSERELSGSEGLTTNNRMELMAAIAGLEALKRPCDVVVTSDSQYLVKGMTEWLAGWVKKGWKNSKKEEVLNRDLWEQLLALSKVHRIDWVWVQGHNGHPENERCDELARAAIDNYRKGVAPLIMSYFLIEISEQEIKREREKARELRRTQWWKNRIAKGICHYCGGTFPADELTMDHLVPVVRGGKSARGNVVPACKSCNNKKKHMLPVEWEEYLHSQQNEE